MIPRSRARVLAMIQAGGQGSRMDVLTREVPKPLLPFAGTYRLIDVPLSNLQNSQIDDVWISVQYLGQSISDALGNGKPWDLDRHSGGFKLLIPEEGNGSPADEGFVNGNAEELLQNREFVRRFAPDALVVLSADHVYRLDYRAVVDEHLAHGAECTIVTTQVSLRDAAHHAVVESDDSGLVTGFAYKPDEPSTTTVATEIFVYDPEVLVQLLEELHRRTATRADEADSTGDDDDPVPASQLGDFGEHLLPALVERGRTYARPLEGYWRDLGRPETYFRAHQELLTGRCDVFDDPAWTYRGNSTQRPPAWFAPGSEVADSLVSAGAVVHGRVLRSVLGPGVRVAEGAEIRDSLVFADVVVEAGAVLDHVIVDTNSVVGAGARIGAFPAADATDDDLVLVGRGSTVAPGQVLNPGARLEPGTTAD